MADYTKNLVVKLSGDTQSAQKAFAELEAATARSAKITADLAVKNSEAWKAFEQQLAKTNQAVDAIGQQTPGLLSRLSTALNQNFGASHPTTAGLLDAAGISESQAAVAGGVAIAGAAVAKFGVDSVKSFTQAADAVRQFQAVSGATAEQASVFVNASNLMGVSAESLSTAIGRQAVNIDKNAAKLRDYGIEAVRTNSGAVDQIGTFNAIIKVLENTADSSQRATIENQVFGRSWQGIAQVLNLTKEQYQQLMAAAKQGPILSQEDVNRSLAFKESSKELGQEFEKIKDRVGLALAPALTVSAKIALELVRDMDVFVEGSLKGVAALTGLGSHLPSWLGGDLFRNIHDGANNAVDALHGVGNAADDTGDGLQHATFKAIDLSNALSTVSAHLKAGQADWAAYNDTAHAVTSTTNDYQAALDALDTVQQKTSTSVSNSGQKIADAAGRIADAEQNLAQVTADAQQRIQDVNEQSADRIVQAQQRVQDAQDAAADSAVNSAQKVDDAKQRLADAINASLRDSNPYTANRTVEDARQALSRAEADAAKESEKQAKNVGKAQDDLAKTQEQAAKDRTKAEQEASRQIASATKQVEQAQKDLTKATDDAGVATETAGNKMRDAAGKAQTLIDKTFDLGYQTLLMGGSMQDVQPKIDAVRGKIDDLATSGLLSWQQVAELHRQLDALPKQIPLTFYMHLDGAQFKAEIDKIMQESFPNDPNNPLIRSGIESGVVSAAYSNGAIPAFAEGGIVPGPTGKAQLAIVHGGEAVVPPGSQIVGGSGGDVHIHVAGSIIMEHELGELLTRLRQHGYAGI